MAKRGKLVWQDSDGIWLAPSLAAKRSGLSKPELARRAALGALRSIDDQSGQPVWYLEVEIAKLARDRALAQQGKADRPKPARKLSDAALEAQHTRAWKQEAVTRRYAVPTGVAAHMERIMIADTLDPAKAKKPKGD